MTPAAVHIRSLAGFHDPVVDAGQWDTLLRTGPTVTVFLTHAFQKTWWECFKRGRLLLLAAERDGRICSIAPLFCDGGMVFFVGSGSADYLDFVGQVDAEIVEAFLSTAAEVAPDFCGFRFYHVPEHSASVARLRQAARTRALEIYEEGDLVAPRLVFDGPASIQAAVSKGSLARHENRLRRDGPLEFFHCDKRGDIEPWLDQFFAQHQERWAGTGSPSLFTDPVQRRFYRELTAAGTAAGWLRFSRLHWKDDAVAFHYGFHFAGEFLWYKPSFEIRVQERSPGTVLLSHLLRAATAEPCSAFDFGIGDEGFKRRHANLISCVRTWGLYPKASST